MLREFIIDFPVFFQRFFLSFFQATNNLMGSIIFQKLSIHHKKIFVVFYVLDSYGIKVTLSVSQMVNTVQNIGFSHTVPTYKTVDFSIKIKTDFREILIIEKMKFL